MPAGDDLTVVTFLLAAALAIGLGAVGAAGWKHPYLIRGLFMLAVVLLLAGIAWVPFKESTKEGTVGASIVGRLTSVTESWWAWLAVAAVAVGAILWKYRQGAWLQLP